jgi:hypothetical protein
MCRLLVAEGTHSIDTVRIELETGVTEARRRDSLDRDHLNFVDKLSIGLSEITSDGTGSHGNSTTWQIGRTSRTQ